MFVRAVCLLIGLGLVNGSAAQTAETEDTGPWFGNVKFGYLVTAFMCLVQAAPSDRSLPARLLLPPGTPHESKRDRWTAAPPAITARVAMT